MTYLRNRTRSSQELGSDFAQIFVTKFHSSTIRRALVKEGLYSRVTKTKPYSRPGNRQKRLEFAKEHTKWTVKQWNNVLWCDKSKFEFSFQEKTVCIKKY